MKLCAAWRTMVPWAVAAVLCAPLALSVLIFSLLIDPISELPPDLEASVELLDRGFAPSSEDAPEDANMRRGIVFATSGLACAINGSKRLPGENVELVVLSKTSASLLHFNLLIDPAIAMRPDFVIVQSSLLVATKWNSPPTAAAAARFFWRRQILAVMPRLVLSEPRGRATAFSGCRFKTRTVQEWQDHLEWWTEQMTPLVNPRRDQMRAILLRFVEAGIPVLVVTPPANKFNVAYFARVREEALSTIEPAANAAAISFLEPTRLWPNEEFFDPTHIDPNQAEAYREWLSAAIVAALGD